MAQVRKVTLGGQGYFRHTASKGAFGSRSAFLPLDIKKVGTKGFLKAGPPMPKGGAGMAGPETGRGCRGGGIGPRRPWKDILKAVTPWPVPV